MWNYFDDIIIIKLDKKETKYIYNKIYQFLSKEHTKKSSNINDTKVIILGYELDYRRRRWKIYEVKSYKRRLKRLMKQQGKDNKIRGILQYISMFVTNLNQVYGAIRIKRSIRIKIKPSPAMPSVQGNYMLSDASKIGNAAVIYHKENKLSYIIQSITKDKKKLEQRCLELALKKKKLMRIENIFSDYIAISGYYHNCIIWERIQRTYPWIKYRHVSGYNIIENMGYI